MSNYLAEVLLVFRIVGSLALVAVVPGLVLSFWLFPRDTLDLPERLLVAITASIAVSTLVGFALVRFGGGLQPIGFVIGTIALTAVFSLGAFLRSLSDPHRGTGQRIMPDPDQADSRRQRGKRYLVAILILVPLVMIAAAAAVLLRKDPSLALTEFYVSPEYLQEILGEPERSALPDFSVEIVNREGRPMIYRIEVWADGTRRLDELADIQLPPGATRQLAIPGAMPGTEDAAFIELRLFSEIESAPIAELRLWIEPGHSQDEID